MANFSPQRSGGPFGRFRGGSHGPILNLPRMTKILLLINIAVFILCWLAPIDWFIWVVSSFGFDPLRFTAVSMLDWTAIVSPVTSLFLHGSWMHLLSNMVGLVLFGTIVERAIGERRMLILALATGLLGNLAFLAVNFGESIVSFGASGLTSGMFGAALRLLVRQRSGRDTQQIWIFAAIWIALSLLPALTAGGGGIAWEAHVGGFLAGLLLIDSFDRRGRFRVM